MDSSFQVDQENNLVQISDARSKYPAIIAVLAKVISYVFHPLFIPVYLSWVIVETQSYLFAAFSSWDRTIFLVRFGVMYTFFPLASVLLMKALGFVSSIKLKTQRDRIIPYVTCMIYYWWMWYVLHNQSEFPRECVILSLAIFLASIGGLMANIRFKVSMHAIAAGIMAAFVIMLGFAHEISFGAYISLSILLAGLICTARLIDSDHTTKEIYWGLFIGIISILIASWFS